MPTLKAETAAARRENLINAAMRCLARNGYRATSLRDIAREAGVTTGSVYVHFGGKDDLIAAVGQKLDDIRTEAFREPPSDVPVGEAIGSTLTTLTDYLDQEDGKELLYGDIVMVAEALNIPHLREQLAETDRQHFRAYGALLNRNERWREGVDPGALARVVTGSLFGLLILSAYHPDIDRNEYIACVQALVEAAIGDRRGEARSD